jgi:hypothetical protein
VHRCARHEHHDGAARLVDYDDGTDAELMRPRSRRGLHEHSGGGAEGAVALRALAL